LSVNWNKAIEQFVLNTSHGSEVVPFCIIQLIPPLLGQLLPEFGERWSQHPLKRAVLAAQPHEPRIRERLTDAVSVGILVPYVGSDFKIQPSSDHVLGMSLLKDLL